MLPSYTIINTASRSSRGHRKVFIFIDAVNNNDYEALEKMLTTLKDFAASVLLKIAEMDAV